MPNDPRLPRNGTPDEAHADDAELTMAPLDDRPKRAGRPPSRRLRRVRARRSIAVTALALVVALVLVLSAGGLWPQVGAAWRGAIQVLHSPTLVVQSPVPWAQVWVDGHLAGRAGAPVTLGLGGHSVTVRATGFAPYMRRLSFWDTLSAMHTPLTFAATAHALPGTVPQMEQTINRAFDATYGTTAPIVPGEPYAPGQVARVPLRAHITVAMITGGPLFTCLPSDATCQQNAEGGLAGTPYCRSATPEPGVLCVSPYLAFLNQLGPDDQRVVASVRVQIEVAIIEAATGHLVRTTIVTAGYQSELVQLWPGRHGWQASAALVDANMVNDIQAQAGAAAIQALPGGIASRMLPLDVVSLTSPGEGVLFETGVLPAHPPAPPIAAVWLFHLGMLFAVNPGTRQATPELPPVPPALVPLVRQVCSACLG
jgi:hypothetical protein